MKYTQCLGRGLRTFPGKEDCLVIDVVGVSERLDLQTLPRLFNLRDVPAPTDSADGDRARSTGDRRDDRVALDAEADARRGQREGADGEMRSRRVSMLAARRRTRGELRWLRHGRCWLVSLGQGGHARARARRRALARRAGCDRRQVEQLAGDVDLGYAHGIAEDYVRQTGAHARSPTPTRGGGDAPMNDAQAGLLRRLGITAARRRDQGRGVGPDHRRQAARLLDRLADQAA